MLSLRLWDNMFICGESGKDVNCVVGLLSALTDCYGLDKNYKNADIIQDTLSQSCTKFRKRNLLYNITFRAASTFCALNFFERGFSPNTLLIEEKTISAIHLLPASFSCFHPVGIHHMLSTPAAGRESASDVVRAGRHGAYSESGAKVEVLFWLAIPFGNRVRNPCQSSSPSCHGEISATSKPCIVIKNLPTGASCIAATQVNC